MAKKIFLSILIVFVLAAAGYFLKDRFVEKTTRQAVLEERKQWQKRAEELEEKVATLENEIVQKEPGVDEKKLSEAFGKAPEGTYGEGAETEKTANKVINFFMYLDQKGYLTKNKIYDSSQDYFLKLIDRLNQARPVVSGETKDLYTLIKNITYFYRVLGKENIQVIKDILKGEAEIIEPTMELFFKWMDPWNRSDEPGRTAVSPEVMYEYACFFIKTIAGQSYLFRRDSKIRSLMLYYCILILDEANRHELNRYGVDIRPHLDALINDIQSHSQLANRVAYLKKLKAIKKRY